MSDSEWTLIAPVIPSARRGERRRSVDLHEVLNGILFVLEMGCQWRHLPTDLPPRSTCHDYLTLWGWDGTLQRIHHALYVLAREQEGREASPTAAIVDSQSVRAAQKGGPTRTRVGYDTEKKIKGAKYHIAVDTLGLLLNVTVHHAGIQDRDGAPLVLDTKARATFSFAKVIFADGGYQGPVCEAHLAKTGDWELSIVKRSDQAEGFVVLPKRWIVERTLSWLPRCRRLVRHHELYFQTSVAFIRLAMIRLMLRRLSRK